MIKFNKFNISQASVTYAKCHIDGSISILPYNSDDASILKNLFPEDFKSSVVILGKDHALYNDALKASEISY